VKARERKRVAHESWRASMPERNRVTLEPARAYGTSSLSTSIAVARENGASARGHL